MTVQTLGEPGPGSRRLRWARFSLAGIIGQTALVGVWAAAAPQSFVDDFPGPRLHWIAWSGATDYHFVRDVGLAQLALLVVAVYTFRRPEWGRVLGWAWTVMAVPHLLFHATHRAGLGQAAIATSLTALTLSVVAGLALIVFSPSRPRG